MEWVRLTRRGYAAVLQMADDDILLAALQERSVWAGERVSVDAPYVAWLRVQQRLISHCFGPTGGKRAEVPGKYVTALRSITKALNFIDTHPALSGKGALGWWALIIPAWGDGDDRYQPLPRAGKMFVNLTPVWDAAGNGQRVTRWIPLPGSRIDEARHLLLSGHPVPLGGNPHLHGATAE